MEVRQLEVIQHITEGSQVQDNQCQLYRGLNLEQIFAFFFQSEIPWFTHVFVWQLSICYKYPFGRGAILHILLTQEWVYLQHLRSTEPSGNVHLQPKGGPGFSLYQ